MFEEGQTRCRAWAIRDDIRPSVSCPVESDLFVQVSSLLAVGNVPEEIIEAIRLGRMTALSKPDLENEADSELFVQVCAQLAVGNVPEEIIDTIRLGRMTALSKPDGGVRGIVVGDIVRRLVARTIAKQIAKKVEETTAPFQYALTTKGGCECVAHILQTLTELNQETTIISIDGMGAYDLISRNAMMEGFLRMEDGDQILPFVRMFYGTPSTYLWEDEMGVTQSIPQGEGGEQGDPLHAHALCIGTAPSPCPDTSEVGEH